MIKFVPYCIINDHIFTEAKEKCQEKNSNF